MIQRGKGSPVEQSLFANETDGFFIDKKLWSLLFDSCSFNLSSKKNGGKNVQQYNKIVMTNSSFSNFLYM